MKKNNNALIVGHSYWERWVFAALCLFIFAFYFLPFYTGWGSPGVMLYFYAGITLLLTFPLRLLYQSLCYLCLYQEGIEIHRFRAPTQFLDWQEITQIRGSVWNSDLLISNRQGNIAFRVNSSYDNIHPLLELLIYFRPDLFQAIQPLTLHISPLPLIFITAITVQLVIFGLHGVFTSRYGPPLFFLLLLCLAIFVFALWVIPYSLSIVGNLLVLRFPFRTKTLNAVDVRSIQKITRFDFIYEWGEVTIHCLDNNVEILMFYNLGVSLLYAFLSAWHRLVTTPRLAAGTTEDHLSRPQGIHPQPPYQLPSKASV